MTVAEFDLPLNAVARLLPQLGGRADDLRFAVFDGDSAAPRDLLRAQQRASDLLWQALPAPCRLLAVGIGVGTTLARLQAAGFDALGITPDAAQIAEAHERQRQRQGPALALECARLASFKTSAGQWDSLLFLESAQSIDPLDLFSAAQRLLHSGPTTLIVMDEFALQRRGPEHGGLHLLGDFCALAARCGWRLTQHTDLSRAVAPTLDVLIDGTRALRPQRMAERASSAEQIEGLAGGLTRRQALYAEGVYGYALLRFERAQAPTDQLVRLGTGDSAQAMRALFERIFKHAMSQAHWAWKYAGAEGPGHGVGLMREGRMVAHYGGVPRRILDRGQPALACQVCDVMVERSANAALVRKGPLYQVAATFLEAQIGWGRAHRLGFGFPSERAYAVAQRMGLYDEVDTLMSLSWAVAPVALGRGVPAWVSTLVQPAPQPLGVAGTGFSMPERQLINALWADMAAALPDSVLGVRDAAWLQHRYVQHPTHHYEIWLLRQGWQRRPLGVLVLRRHDTHLALLDLIAAPDDFGPLLQAAIARAQALGLPRVEAWVSASQMSRLASAGHAPATVTDPKITLPHCVHTVGPDADALRGRWWLTAGDADFT